MMQTSGLTVRQYERQEIALPIEFEIAPDHHAQVTFSSTSGLADVHRIDGSTVDISPGGAGLTVRQFIPRAARGVLRLFDPKPVGNRDDGSPILALIFEHEVKVRRVMLSDHDPTYFVGVSFVNQGSEFDSHIGLLLGRIASMNRPIAPQPAQGDGHHA